MHELNSCGLELAYIAGIAIDNVTHLGQLHDVVT